MIVGNSSTHQQQQIKPHDALPLNILMFGESQSGKTVLRHLLSTNQPLDKNQHFTQTIGVEFSVVEDSIVSDCFSGQSFSNDGTVILPKVRFFEVVGGSRFRTLLVSPTWKLYDGCIFVLTREENESCEQSISRMSHLLTEIEDCFRIKNEEENESCDGKSVAVKKSLKPIYVCFLNKNGALNDDQEFLSVAKEIISKRIQEGEVRMFSLFEDDQLPSMRQMLKEIIFKSLLEKVGSTELPRIQSEKQEEGGFMSKVANFFFGSS